MRKWWISPSLVSRLAFIALLLLGVIVSAEPGPASREVDVLTFHGDIARTGWNAAERKLTPASITAGAFGKLWTAPVEGDIYAEPLVLSSLAIRGGLRTVVYVVTEHNLVYALDAADGARLWGPISLGTPVPRSSLSCGNIDPVGITSTPVIDRASSTIYVVGLTTTDNGATKVYKMAALDLATGTMRSGWPTVIAPPAASGFQFQPAVQQQRGALTLVHNTVYVPFGGYFGDCGDYHGWVVGMPASAPRRQQAFATPTGREGGIWATGGLAGDPAGNLYASTGNSDSGGTVDLSNSVVRLLTSPTLTFSREMRDFFTPSNFVALNDTDTDLGSAAPLVLPPQRDSTTPDLVFIAGKQGVGYLINRSNMGGVTKGNGITGEGVYSRCVFGTCQGGGREVFSGFAYWDGGSIGRLILMTGHGPQPSPCRGTGGVVALRLGVASGSRSSMFQVLWCSLSMADPGAPSVSSAGSQDGIVWIVDTRPGTLHALNAQTGAEIYTSTGQDAPSSTHRFITPAVSDGRVYVGAANAVIAYGHR